MDRTRAAVVYGLPVLAATIAGCSYASFAPSDGATVTISAPGFKSTTVTFTYSATADAEGCCPGLIPGGVALVPQ